MMYDFGNYVPGPGMESGIGLLTRVSSFLEDLKRQKPADTILVSTHGGRHPRGTCPHPRRSVDILLAEFRRQLCLVRNHL
jgi:hypothetical protein